MMKKIAASTVFMLMALADPAHAVVRYYSEGQRAVERVGERLAAKDCKGAVAHLNAGLEEGYPAVALQAAIMFEHGLCLKPDLNRALQFYGVAADGGSEFAGYHLVSRFASAEHGPDTAAALWWAKRIKLDAGICTASLPATDDPDVFVAELGKWSGQKLAQCNYVVGVISTVRGQAGYPGGAVVGLEATMKGRFQPAVPRIDWTLAAFGKNSQVAHPSVDVGQPGLSAPFEEGVRQATRVALERFAQPQGIDPALEIELTIDYDITVR
jgi:hypothetical protein